MSQHFEHPSLHPVGTQSAMEGDDWTSDRERKRQAKADADHRKAMKAAIPKLEAAAEALRVCYCAAMEAGHPDKLGQADGRLRLAGDLYEYASYLDSVVTK